MPFSTKEKSGGKFVSFKEGKFKVGENLHTDWEDVKLIDIDFEDADYEGTPYRKIILFIEDGGQLKELGMKMGSGYANSFACICPNLNVNARMDMSAKTEKKDGHNFTGLFIRQEGKPVKWYYTKANDEKSKRPMAKEIVTGKGSLKKVTLDFSDRNEWYEQKITKFRELLVKATGGYTNFKPAKLGEDTKSEGDLPF